MATKTKARERDTLFDAPAGEVLPPEAKAKPQPKRKAPQQVAVRERDPSPPARPGRVVPMTNALDIMSIIERLATNKEVDPEKLEKLLSLQERLLDRNSRAAFDQAMVEMQPNLPVITKDGRIVVREKDAQGKRTGEKTQDTPYAKWEKLMPLLKPILYEHGFALTHRSSTAPDGRLRVTAVLRGHGHTDDTNYLDLQADVTGSKNNAQGWASALSYGKRHTACSALNIVTKDEDDDAKLGGGQPSVVGDAMAQEQVDQLIELCEAVECPKDRFVAHMNSKRPKGHPEAAGIATLPAARYDEAVAALRSFEANKKEREAAKQQQGAEK